MQRKVKRKVMPYSRYRWEKSFYNSLNQTAIEVFRTSDQDIEHNFGVRSPRHVLYGQKMGKKRSEQFNSLKAVRKGFQTLIKVQNSNLKVKL